MSTRSRKWILLGLSTVVSLVLAEVLVRSLGLAPRVAFADASRYRLSDNPRLGYEPVPFSRWNSNGVESGETTNSLGLRDGEHTLEKPEGVFRILVLGDSVAEGWGIQRRDDTLPALLERQLGTGGLRAEVLNFGVSGYNTMQEVALLEEKGLAFQPDLVLVAYCLNDIERNDGQLLDNLLALEESGVSRSPSSWNRRLAASALYRLVRYRVLGRAGRASDASRKKYAALYENRVPQSLQHLAGLSRRHGFETLVVVFPWFRGLMNEEQEYGRMHRAVERISAESRLGHLDLVEAFQRCQARTDGPLARDPLHPNEAGHRCAAQAIARHISERRLAR